MTPAKKEEKAPKDPRVAAEERIARAREAFDLAAREVEAAALARTKLYADERDARNRL
jgi:hypothetical protein